MSLMVKKSPQGPPKPLAASLYKEFFCQHQREKEETVECQYFQPGQAQSKTSVPWKSVFFCLRIVPQAQGGIQCAKCAIPLSPLPSTHPVAEHQTAIRCLLRALQTKVTEVLSLFIHKASSKPNSWKRSPEGSCGIRSGCLKGAEEGQEGGLSPAWRNLTKALLCEDQME